MFCKEPPNGWRYPLMGGTRERCFAGTNFKPRKHARKRGDSSPSSARCVGQVRWMQDAVPRIKTITLLI